jgi:lipoate-protein ligase A
VESLNGNTGEQPNQNEKSETKDKLDAKRKGLQKTIKIYEERVKYVPEEGDDVTMQDYVEHMRTQFRALYRNKDGLEAIEDKLGISPLEQKYKKLVNENNYDELGREGLQAKEKKLQEGVKYFEERIKHDPTEDESITFSDFQTYLQKQYSALQDNKDKLAAAQSVLYRKK